jgi:signal transduction histidine kinase
VLKEAAERVRSAWNNERGDALYAGEVSETLLWLTRSVERARDELTLTAPGAAASVLGRYLLERLRAETLTAWSRHHDDGDSRLLLELLQGFERVREAIEPDWSKYWGSRLSGPDGLDLVVEVAHDLRSPLTSILFLAETLQKGQSGEINDLQRRQLGLIYAAALGLSSTASDVIELARAGDQLVEKEPQPFSVTSILESVRDMVRPIAEEKGLTLRLLPPASDQRLGRPLALSRVLLNLTTNALKFTDEGYVEITTQATGLAQLEFAVRDTGHGIAPEALTNLYQPFRRSLGRAGRSGYYFSGTGLGLAMCRRLVEAMGSQLKVETRPDWGTRFFFELSLPALSHL